MVSTDGQRGGAIQLRPDGRVGRSLCSLPLGVHWKDYRSAGDPTRAPRCGPSLTSFTSMAKTQAFRANPPLHAPEHIVHPAAEKSRKRKLERAETRRNGEHHALCSSASL